MQNPFRSNDDPGRPELDRDERRPEARDRRPDEYRTWGDGGGAAEAFRREERAYRRHPSGPAGAWSQDDYQRSQYGGGPQFGQDYGSPDHGFQNYGPGSQGRSGQYGSRTDQGYGGQRYPTRGYAPGAQIWEGSGPGMGGQSHEHHDFEPDYLHWREQQLSAFDRDYSDWRNERREKFSSDFDSWRQNRARTQAENPLVGDVADGGTGDASEAKKR